MATNKKKLIYYIDKGLLQAIDTYRFKHCFPNRAATVIWLITYALNQNPTPPPQRNNNHDL